MAQNQSTRYPFNGLGPEQFFILLLQAARALNWQMGNKDDKYILKVPLSPESDSEMLVVGIEGDAAVIERQKTGFRLGNTKNNDNVVLLTSTLNELRSVHNGEWLTQQYEEMAAKQQAYEKDIEERAKNNALTASEKISLARGTHYVTYGIIAANALVYLLMAITSRAFMDFPVDVLVKWGGAVRYLTTGGEWYRLLTCMFLHEGLIHIAFNMYALLYVGAYLEPLLGRWRYLAVYLACGVFASLASTWWRTGEDVGIGASGAIFGLFGVFLALLTTNFVEQNVRKPMLRSIGFFIVFNLAYGTMGNIDNVAHVGGLVIGIVFGYLYYYVFISRKDNMVASIFITIALTIGAVYVILPAIKDDTKKFMQAMERFGALEDKALAPMQASDTTYSPVVAAQLKKVSIPAWEQCNNIFDSTSNYVIPPYYKKRKDLLKRYIGLQIIETNLLIKRDSVRTAQFDAEITTNHKNIKSVVDSLSNQ